MNRKVQQGLTHFHDHIRHHESPGRADSGISASSNLATRRVNNCECSAARARVADVDFIAIETALREGSAAHLSAMWSITSSVWRCQSGAGTSR